MFGTAATPIRVTTGTTSPTDPTARTATTMPSSSGKRKAEESVEERDTKHGPARTPEKETGDTSMRLLLVKEFSGRLPKEGLPAAGAEDRATELLSCLQDNCLDLGKIERVTLDDVSGLSSECWAALDVQAGPGGIRTVILPPNIAKDPGAQKMLGRKLAQLESLEQLVVDVPAAGETHLDFASAAGKKLHSIELRVPSQVDGDRLSASIKMAAPEGVKVQATGAPYPSIHKSFVQYMRDGKSVGEPCTLAGMPYQRQASDFYKDGMDQVAAQTSAMANLNMDVPFAGTTAPVACRHLATQWLVDREAYHKLKATGSGEESGSGGEDTKLVGAQRFSFEHMKSREAISKLDRKALEASRDKVLAQKDWLDGIEFSPARFGDAITSRLRSMSPGDVRLFGISLGNHYMALELQVKSVVQGGMETRQHVAALYDPNVTATHTRMVLDDPGKFAGRPLSEWIGKGLGAQYLSGGVAGGSLYPYPPVSEAEALENQKGASNPLVGQLVEPASVSPDDQLDCRNQKLQAVWASDDSHLLCVSREISGISCLTSYRKSADQLDQLHVPKAVIQDAVRRGHAVYWIPVTELRAASSPSRGDLLTAP